MEEGSRQGPEPIYIQSWAGGPPLTWRGQLWAWCRFPSPTPRQDSHKDSSVHRSVKVWGHETQYGAKKDGEGKMRFLMDSLMISINPRVSLIPGASTQPTRKERKQRLPETHPLLGLTRVTVSWPERM